MTHFVGSETKIWHRMTWDILWGSTSQIGDVPTDGHPELLPHKDDRWPQNSGVGSARGS